jgi:hypothetical protein
MCQPGNQMNVFRANNLAIRYWKQDFPIWILVDRVCENVVQAESQDR